MKCHSSGHNLLFLLMDKLMKLGERKNAIRHNEFRAVNIVNKFLPCLGFMKDEPSYNNNMANNRKNIRNFDRYNLSIMFHSEANLIEIYMKDEQSYNNNVNLLDYVAKN